MTTNPIDLGEWQYDTRLAVIAQEDYCRKKNLPVFAPADGVCPFCLTNIYSSSFRSCPDSVGGAGVTGTYSGIPVYKAANSLITSCPHCHRSFCD